MIVNNYWGQFFIPSLCLLWESALSDLCSFFLVDYFFPQSLRFEKFFFIDQIWTLSNVWFKHFLVFLKSRISYNFDEVQRNFDLSCSHKDIFLYFFPEVASGRSVIHLINFYELVTDLWSLNTAVLFQHTLRNAHPFPELLFELIWESTISLVYCEPSALGMWGFYSGCWAKWRCSPSMNSGRCSSNASEWLFFCWVVSLTLCTDH